jgi:hypothetical protein
MVQIFGTGVQSRARITTQSVASRACISICARDRNPVRVDVRLATFVGYSAAMSERRDDREAPSAPPRSAVSEAPSAPPRSAVSAAPSARPRSAESEAPSSSPRSVVREALRAAAVATIGGAMVGLVGVVALAGAAGALLPRLATRPDDSRF